jgi:hypothetical protein
VVNKTLFAKLLFIACAAGILIGHYLIHQLSLPAETALRISEAGLMADGARPYLDFLDNATPFYLYLNLVPELTSRLLSIHPIAITNLLTALYFVLSAATMALLSEIVPGRRNPLKSSIWAVLTVFVLAVLLQPLHFAQANQIFFFALCPYIVCRACTVQGLRVPQKLAFAIGAALCLTILIDPLYCLFALILEFCILFGFFPFSNRHFIFRRYLGVEIKALAALFTIILVIWLLTPSDSTKQYLNIISRINYYSYGIFQSALFYTGTASDIRPIIYLAAFLLIVSLPLARRHILVRFFGVAALLGLGLLVLQGATLSYQTYPLVSFAAMALASGVTLPMLRQLFLFLPKFSWPPLNLGQHLYMPVSGLALFVFGLGTYLVEFSQMGQGDRFDLGVLGYCGFADKRDLTVLSDLIEKLSAVRQPVAILGFGVRPAYPLLTQLRRKPGLSLTWGFPLNILNVLEEPIYANQVEQLKDFKKVMYAQMRGELSASSGAPGVVLITQDEDFKRIMESAGVIKALQDHYDVSGIASLIAPGSEDGHPPLEYVGYRAAFDIYRHK